MVCDYLIVLSHFTIAIILLLFLIILDLVMLYVFKNDKDTEMNGIMFVLFNIAFFVLLILPELLFYLPKICLEVIK